MDELTLFSRFGLALAIGLLVGLEREYSQGEGNLLAGARTFALISLLGAGTALLGEAVASPWPLVAAFLLVGGLVATGYLMAARVGRVGLTTEMAALVTFATGALCLHGYISLAAALGVATAVLLSLKLEVRELVSRLSRQDVYATLKFAVITAIVLPLLPARTYGPPPLNVLSPRDVWLMVVFISGIGFLGYVLIKLVGPRRGIGLTGLLGGLVSSTAVTLSFSQRARKAPSLSRALALAISLSWTVMFVRVLIEATVVGDQLAEALWPPILASGAVGLLYCLFLLLSERPAGREEVSFSAPFELGPAVKFGLLYALILVG
ncbi:MgtC/SapB family protein, partial [Candidatus Acetothermia bacterium]